MVDSLNALSDALADAVEAAGASVVGVEARRRFPASGIVWSADGLIVTAHHVVQVDEGIRVGLPGGETVPTALVGRAPQLDLALLRAEADSLTVPTWAEGDTLRVGKLVLALGRPRRSISATHGIISALAGAWRTPIGGQVDRFVQTDVLMYPGFSGGPLVDVAGRVAGLNTSALSRGSSLTLPAETVRRAVDDLLKHGHMRRGYLGIGAQPARLPAGLSEDLGQETGLLLVSVEEDGPADRAGLVLGDTIVAFGGEPVHSLDDLLGLLSEDRIGQEVELRIVRGGRLEGVTVAVGEKA